MPLLSLLCLASVLLVWFFAFENQVSAAPVQAQVSPSISPSLPQHSVIPIEGDSLTRTFRIPAPSQSQAHWFNFIVSYWDNQLDPDLSFNPYAPYPSESPIPNEIGLYPDQIGHESSSEGLNEAAYDRFVLNECFYDEEEDEPPIQVYDNYKGILHSLMRLAERGSLSQNDKQKWRKVAKAFITSYKEEQGAIFFDAVFTQQWKFCGWVDMSKTFVDTDKSMRLCASLVSLGMDDITRSPEEGKDFIIPGHTDAHEIEDLTEPVLDIADRKLRLRRKTVRDDSFTVVDLFGYPEYCEFPLEENANCYAFCCLSPYYGSAFCNECSF